MSTPGHVPEGHTGGLRGAAPPGQHVPEGHTGGLRGAASPGQPERQVPFYCPYCGDEDLRPAGPAGGSWRCGACARSFELRFAGLSPGGHTGTAPAVDRTPP